MNSAPDSDDELIGTEIAGYRVASAIGRGGMGAVYRATQPVIDAEVAIKVLARELIDDRESSERFVNEARIANRVRHEGLVKVLFIGLLPDGRPYLIMEHLTGRPLSSLIGGALPLGTLVRRLAEAARAIGAMHDHGVIHRDLKPANLFVTTAGFIKVLDFGIAKLADERSGLTRTGHTIGTPGYMSPEQAQADPLDRRSDIYSFGVVIYEAVVGRRPFEGRVVDALVARELPPHLPDRFPRELDTIVQRAMAHAPRERFGSIAELATALDDVAETLPPDVFGSLIDVEVPEPDPAEASVATANERGGAPPPPIDTPLPTVPAKKPVSRLGRYLVQGTVGRGGEGVVMVGVDPKVQRKVALKLLAVDTVDRRARLLAEAQVMARVSHPNVVTLYELGEDGDQLFLVMEYLEATDLDRWLRESARTWQEIVAMFVEAGRGLAAAHAVGVVHRDFKPANVLLGKDGRPRVGDFGIAELGASAGDGAGTAAFMAPEQVEGETVDARADQFAFCAALWRALHDQAPYAGATAVAIAMAARRGELRTPANRSIPPPITAVLRRGLSASADARFADMNALLAALTVMPKRRRWLAVAAVGAIGAIGALTILETRGTTTSRAPRVLTPSQIRDLADPMDRLRAIAALPDAVRGTREVRALAVDAASDGVVRKIALDSDPIGTPMFSRTDAVLVVPTARDLVLISVATGEQRRIPGPQRTPRRLYLDDTTHQLRALYDDEIATTAVGETSWRTFARCDYTNIAGARAESNHDLTLLACVGTESRIVVDGVASSVTIGMRDAIRFAPSAPRMLVRREESLELYDFSRGGWIASRAVATSVAALGDDVVAYLADGRVVLWDPLTDALAPSPFTADTLEVIGGPHPVVVATAGVNAFSIHFAREPLRFETGGPPQPVAMSATGSRVVEHAASLIVVRDFARGVAWRRTGAPGTVVADHRGEVVASLDARALRLWTVGALPPTVIRDGVLATIADDSVVTMNVAARPPYRAFDLAGRLRHELTDATSRLAGYRPLLLVERGGVTLRWNPTAKTLEPLGVTARAAVEFGGQLYAEVERQIVRVGDRTPMCRGFLLIASLDRSTLLIGAPDQKIHACRLTDGSITELAAGAGLAIDTVTDPNATWWVMSRDGSRAAAVHHGRLQVVDTRTGTRIPNPELAKLQVESVAFGSTATQMIVAAKQGLILVEGSRVTTLTTAPSKHPSFTRDGTQVVTLSRSRIVVWKLDDRTSHELGMLAESGDVTSDLEVRDDHIVAHTLKRTRIAIWPIEPPDLATIDRRLATLPP